MHREWLYLSIMDMLKQAVDAVSGGEVVVFPTDTVFGIGCDPFNEEAVAKLFAIKKRPAEKSIPILVDSIESAKGIADISPECEALLEKHWPGALTVVVPSSTTFPANLTLDDTVALRMPNHEDLLEIITLSGGLLTATSANISGKPALTSYDDAYATFAESVAMVLPGVAQKGKASTIVDCTAEQFKVLREGPVTI